MSAAAPIRHGRLPFAIHMERRLETPRGLGVVTIIGALVVALCAAMVWYLRRATAARTVALVAVVLGGALGNLLDRLFRADDGFMSGEVVDFIDVVLLDAAEHLGKQPQFLQRNRLHRGFRFFRCLCLQRRQERRDHRP